MFSRFSLAQYRPLSIVTRRSLSSKLPFTDLDPLKISGSYVYTVNNFVSGKWEKANKVTAIPDPLNGEKFIKVAETSTSELTPFIENGQKCLKSGLHNPFKNPERYLHYGAVCAEAAAMLRRPEVLDFFVKLIQRVAPKSTAQAEAEIVVTRKFLENFSGDQVRFLARAFQVPGDRAGQLSTGYRFPYGNVVIIAPFNFPMEIPVLQLMGALFMGNKVLIKGDSRVAIVLEQFLRLLHHCGMPLNDVDFINCDGPVMQTLLREMQPRMTQFTGSSRVAEALAKELNGKIKIEDAGWDWKILGPDVHDIDYVAYVSDQDAYAYSGQKCSAQSVLFAHENWVKAGFLDKIRALAARRKLDDFTLVPVLTVNNKRFQEHMDALLKISGVEVLFGGDYMENHSIPDCYGSFKPTAVKIPIDQMLRKENYDLCTTEIFGPFQVVVEYNDKQLDKVLEVLERTHAHLTAAIVSRDIQFQNRILSSTVNGTTYSGILARTTGAPQNHWFGPAGDPRGAGIGTPEAIKLVWSCHREVIYDQGPAPANWRLPPPS